MIKKGKEEKKEAGEIFSHNELCNNIIMNRTLFSFGDGCEAGI
jgi:hypothetical protein